MKLPVDANAPKPDAPSQELRRAESLVAIVLSSDKLMSMLRCVRTLELQSWCIGAGAVRNLVWDSMHGHGPSEPDDVDVVYFDPVAAPELDGELEDRLRACMPGVRWEVTNQAHVHDWFRIELGRVVSPLASLVEGIATWPEVATCVGVYLAADDSVNVVAPFGLDDLFELRVSHNSSRATADEYIERVRTKKFRSRWPRLTILDPQDA